MEKYIKMFEEISEEYDNWWGFEEGYTYEESSNFYEGISNQLFSLVQELLEVQNG